MPRRSKVHALPPELKEWLDDQLLKRGFGDYKQLAAYLQAQGADVSASGLQRYGSPFERTMAAAKVAVDQARALVDANPDDEDKLGSALVRVTQEKILKALMEVELDPEQIDVNKLFKNAAEIGKASVGQKRFSMEARAAIEAKAAAEARKKLLAEQEASLQEVAKAQGMDDAQVDFWRKKFLGVAT